VKLCENIEQRRKCHEQELNSALLCVQKIAAEGKPPLPESYKKYIAVKDCDDTSVRTQKNKI